MIIPCQPRRGHSQQLEDRNEPGTLRERNSDNSLLPVGRCTESYIHSFPIDQAANFREYFLLRLCSNMCSPQGMIRLLSGFVNKDVPDGSLQHSCIKSLTASYYSGRASDYHVRREAFCAYSKALAGVRNALARRLPQLGTGTLLMSIMCLCLYESILVTQPRSWAQHYVAISNLVKGSPRRCWYSC